LFGSTNPYTAGDTPLTRVLYDRLPCSPCHRHPTCHGRFDCMRQLTVDRVLTAAEEVVKFESRNTSQELQIKAEG
jgi:heptosyltransferase-1